jgi:hypothetical protein
MIEDLLDMQVSTVDTFDFILGFVQILIYSILLKVIYDKFSLSVSNKIMTSSMFPVFALAIFVIVITIKSSLVLSLGLVGALSIIRFRTAIKEPEQLIYYLALTAVSISVAANNYLLSLFMVLFMFVYSVYRKRKYKSDSISQSDLLVLKFKSLDIDGLKKITDNILKYDANMVIQNFHIKKDYSLVVLRISNIDYSVLKGIEKSIYGNKELILLEFQLMGSVD